MEQSPSHLPEMTVALVHIIQLPAKISAHYSELINENGVIFFNLTYTDLLMCATCPPFFNSESLSNVPPLPPHSQNGVSLVRKVIIDAHFKLRPNVVQHQAT